MSEAKCHVARVSIEFRTPFLVASGEATDLSDAAPVTDANGLPAIPGSSLAGVLRAAYEEHFSKQASEELFGAPGGSAAGAGSRLWVSWGRIHDAANVPVEGLSVEGLAPDAVLENARSGSRRDHVRIHHRGAAEEAGKFDETVVPAGHRFTFELRVEGDGPGNEDREALQWLLDFLASERARLGGKGRRGLGAFRVPSGGCRIRTFDLGNPEDARLFASLPVRLDVESKSLKDYRPEPLAPERTWHVLELELKAQDYWAVHGEEPWVVESEEKPPDANPVREARVRWTQACGGGPRGFVSDPTLYVPGSAVKGPLSHRVAFHYNLIRSHFADDEQAPDDLTSRTGERNPAVRVLFGAVHDADGEAGGAGRVYIDDVWLADAWPETPPEERLQRIPHTSLDRFTGGVRASALFEERVLFEGPSFRLRIGMADFPALDPDVQRAFREALRDLAEGRLALGGGRARGHGRFRLEGSFDAMWRSFLQEDET